MLQWEHDCSASPTETQTEEPRMFNFGGPTPLFCPENWTWIFKDAVNQGNCRGEKECTLAEGKKMDKKRYKKKHKNENCCLAPENYSGKCAKCTSFYKLSENSMNKWANKCDAKFNFHAPDDWDPTLIPTVAPPSIPTVRYWESPNRD